VPDKTRPRITDEIARLSIEETRAWLAAIVDSSDDAIVSKNLESIVRSWNAGAERLFGYSAAEMIGQSFSPALGAASGSRTSRPFGSRKTAAASRSRSQFHRS